MIKSQQSNAFLNLKISSCIIVFGLQPDFNLIVSVVHEDYWTFGHDLMNLV